MTDQPKDGAYILEGVHGIPAKNGIRVVNNNLNDEIERTLAEEANNVPLKSLMDYFSPAERKEWKDTYAKCINAETGELKKAYLQTMIWMARAALERAKREREQNS